MSDEKIKKWVNELVMRSGTYRRLYYLPNNFYSELAEDEQREVMRQYREAAKDKFWGRETKG